MEHPFTPIPLQEPSKRLSLWFVVVFLLLLVAGVFLYGELQTHVSVATQHGEDAVEPAALAVAEVGGDIAVPPPAFQYPELPVLRGELPPVENFTAHGFLVKDHESGALLYEKNTYGEWSLASITKLMSALVLLEHDIDWAATTQVIKGEWIDTHMYAGDTYTLEQLWYAGLIGSSNKAIATLMSYLDIPHEAFVARMNEKAVELGMGQTRFVEPTGLDARNISTPSDSIILLREALSHERITGALLTHEYTLYSNERQKRHHMWNTNWILLGWIPNSFAEFHGGKTGYIDASQYNFTMQVADDAGHILDVVVLGAESHEARFTEARDIAQAAFDAYVWPGEELIEEEL